MSTFINFIVSQRKKVVAPSPTTFSLQLQEKGRTFFTMDDPSIYLNVNVTPPNKPFWNKYQNDLKKCNLFVGSTLIDMSNSWVSATDQETTITIDVKADEISDSDFGDQITLTLDKGTLEEDTPLYKSLFANGSTITLGEIRIEK